MYKNIEHPLVSIGLPVYNGEAYIERALISLLQQKYKNIEIIISDNASTDTTLVICQNYKHRNNSIRVIQQEENIGIIENFKTVLNEAKGEYFMWAAVDDLWAPDFISEMASELNQHRAAGIAMCAINRVKADGSLVDTIRFQGNLNPNTKSYLGMGLGLASRVKYNLFIYGLFRREVLRIAALSLTDIPSSERWLLLHLSLSVKFRYVDRVLHTRLKQDKHYDERYPLDSYAKNMIESKTNILDFRPVATVSAIIIKSELVPLYRKTYLGIIFIRLVLRMIRPSVVKLLRYSSDRGQQYNTRSSVVYMLSRILRILILRLAPKNIRKKL